MRSKVFALGLLFSACVASAATPFDAFNAHREEIIRGDRVQVGDVRFGVGIGIAKGEQRKSEVSKSRAIISAKADLIARKSTEEIVWPDGFDLRARLSLSKKLSEILNAKAKVRNAEVVELKRLEDDSYRAVVACREGELRMIEKATIEDVKKRLLNSGYYLKHFIDDPEALYTLYVTFREVPSELESIDYLAWGEAELRALFAAEDSATGERKRATINYLDESENDTIGFD